MVSPSSPGAPQLACTSPQALHRTRCGQPVEQGMKPVIRLLLDTVYSTRWKHGSCQAISLRGGPGPHRALTGSVPAHAAPMKQGSLPSVGLCCPAPSNGVTTPPTPSGPPGRPPLPGDVGCRCSLADPQTWATKGLSGSRDTPLTIPRRHAGVPWHPVQAPKSSMAFATGK
jgi:hypothetical protein